MSQDDLDINRAIRSILVKHWIDLGRLSVRSTDGKVWVRGELHRISGVAETLTSAIVSALFEDIRRIRNIRQVYTALENWSTDSGSWQQVGKPEKKMEQQTSTATKTVYDVENKEPGQ